MARWVSLRGAPPPRPPYRRRTPTARGARLGRQPLQRNAEPRTDLGRRQRRRRRPHRRERAREKAAVRPLDARDGLTVHRVRHDLHVPLQLRRGKTAAEPRRAAAALPAQDRGGAVDGYLPDPGGVVRETLHAHGPPAHDPAGALAHPFPRLQHHHVARRGDPEAPGRPPAPPARPRARAATAPAWSSWCPLCGCDGLSAARDGAPRAAPWRTRGCQAPAGQPLPAPPGRRRVCPASM